MDASNQINYAPKPPAARRTRRWIFRAIALLLIIAVALFWITTGSSALRRAYYLHECLVFQQPPTHLVWEINRGAIIHQEVCRPKHAILDGALRNGCGNIFVHELRRPDGTRRLMAVVIDPWRPTDPDGTIRLNWQTWEPTIFLKDTEWGDTAIPAGSGTQLSDWKFFAAQPDPADPSHFTFDFMIDGTRHTCDAWLHNDGKLLISQRP